MAFIWRRKAASPVSSRHLDDGVAQGGLALPLFGDQPAHQHVRGDVHEAALVRHLEQAMARLDLLRRIGPRLAVQQRHPRHPLWRLRHDLQRQVDAHRQTGQRKPLRRVRQYLRRNLFHRVRARVIGHQHLALLARTPRLAARTAPVHIRPGMSNSGSVIMAPCKACRFPFEF
jgi:hypothetical protein